jgi:hypothetical protein
MPTNLVRWGSPCCRPCNAPLLKFRYDVKPEFFPSDVWRNGLVVMKWQPVGGLAELERGVRQRVYAFIATIATPVRFFAFSFLMTLRTWTFTVLKHISNSLAIILFDLPCWIARTTESSRLVSM